MAEVLTRHGPLAEDDITDRLQRAGVADPAGVIDELLDEYSCPAGQLVDDRWVWLPALLAGRIFTHRITADEATHDLLTVTPDLDPITALCAHDDYQRLADGSPAWVVLPGLDDAALAERAVPPDAVDPGGALLLAPGTLAALGVAAGDLVGLRLGESGIVLEAVTAVSAVAAAAGERLAGTLDADAPVYFDAAVWTVCAADPAVFTEPLPPLVDIAGDAGLARNGEWLAAGGFDFDRWYFQLGCEGLALRYDLDPDDAFALQSLLQLYGELAAPVDADDVAELEKLADTVGGLGVVLADPVLAEALLNETLRAGSAAPEALGRFADLLEPRVPRHARVGVRWLRAAARQRDGDIDAVERELLAAEAMNPDWPPVLIDLARIASDRGDAEAGLALLHRADVAPDHPLLRLLERHRPEPRPDLGRNQPCWCGSGRKYKKCHLGREQLPLGERVAWLYTKAMDHALLTGWRPLLIEMGYERCRYDDDLPDPLLAALSDPLVLDVALVEGGGLADFLQRRGTLLPDDERSLAEQWLLVERSVFEVDDVQPGRSVTVRDVRTGDTHAVREATASRALQPGQLICTRVAPAGDGMQFFGAIEPVALHARGPLIDLLDSGPDPVDLVAHLSLRLAPPTLTNTEGDPLVICAATVQVSAVAEVTAALDDGYDRVPGETPPRWHEHVTTHGMQRIRATLVLDGDTLRVETNSEKRMARVLAGLRRIDPALQLRDDTRTTMGDARQAAALARQQPAGSQPALDPADPAVAAMLDAFIRDYEAKWLDEPIPALDGCTPRQAADDPTRRGDLVKLLDSFPAGAAAAGGMDADRLRAALGLR